MKREHAARPGIGVAFVAVEGFHAGRFVQERERAGGPQKIGEIAGVVTGLLGHAGQARSRPLGFHHTDRLAVDDKQVITGAGSERDFPDGNAASGSEIELFVILNDPAGLMKIFINDLARFLLWCHRSYLKGPARGY